MVLVAFRIMSSGHRHTDMGLDLAAAKVWLEMPQVVCFKDVPKSTRGWALLSHKLFQGPSMFHVQVPALGRIRVPNSSSFRPEGGS